MGDPLPYLRTALERLEQASLAPALASLLHAWRASNGAPAIADAITHLALQFWVPTKTGGVDWARKDEASENTVAELRDWGRARGIRVMLCVYNAGGGK